MKLRRMMVLIGLLAVAFWLTMPLIRLWRDPSLRTHQLEIESRSGQMLTLQMGTITAEFSQMTMKHESSIVESYWALLTRTPLPDSDHCSYCQKLRSGVR